MSKWISVNEALPKIYKKYDCAKYHEYSDSVLVIIENDSYKPHYGIASYCRKPDKREVWLFDCIMTGDRVTYWIPIPKLRKKQDGR